MIVNDDGEGYQIGFARKTRGLSGELCFVFTLSRACGVPERIKRNLVAFEQRARIERAAFFSKIAGIPTWNLRQKGEIGILWQLSSPFIIISIIMGRSNSTTKGKSNSNSISST